MSKNPQIICDNSSTGEIIRDGDKVYKNTTVVGLSPQPGAKGRPSLEAEVYNRLHGNQNILPGKLVTYDGVEKIETPYVENIVSLDDIPKDKRQYVGSSFVSKNLKAITEVINTLSNFGFSYNDLLQFACHENRLKLFDFSNVSRKDTKEAIESNYCALSQFLRAFGLEGAASRISKGMMLWGILNRVSAGKSDIESELLFRDAEEAEEIRLLNSANVTPNNLYYVRNARMIQCSVRVGQTEIDAKGNKYIISEEPLSLTEMADWEIQPIIYTGRIISASFQNGRKAMV